MAEQVMTEQVAVRSGIAAGVLFLLTAVVVSTRLPGGYAVGLLLAATAGLSSWLDAPHSLLLAVAGWGFATGFAVNVLGVLTFEPPDLLRLAVFVLAATAASRLRSSHHLPTSDARRLRQEQDER